MTCRAPTAAGVCSTSSNTGAQLLYDNERRLTHWQDNAQAPTKQADFRYDGDGQRVAQAANGTTTYYLGGLEEVAVTGTTSTLTKYYSVPGLPAAVSVGGARSYLANDALGSISAALNDNGTVVAQQLYAPYGGVRYSSGTMPTSQGFTGQRQDAVSGLDYYNARYYDPVLGQFTSADSVQEGLNRYGYVAGNPETHNDPSGHCWFACSIVSAVTSAVSSVAKAVAPVVSAAVSVAAAAADAATGFSSIVSDVKTVFDGKASFLDKVMAVGDLTLNVAMDVSMVVGVGEGAKALYEGGKALFAVGSKVAEHEAAEIAEHEAEETAIKAAEDAGEDAAKSGCKGGLSFSADTLVATPAGERAIAGLKVGDAVTAYDPATGQASTQTVEQTFINRDSDLVDVTLRVAGTNGAAAIATTTPAKGGASHASAATVTQGQAARDEAVHTTGKHPWLTADRGWVLAGNLTPGEPVRTLDGPWQHEAPRDPLRRFPGAAGE